MICQANCHVLAAAALKAQIAAGRIATCSGRADDFRRFTARRLRELWGADRGEVEYRRDGVGEYRATVDTAAGYWDHVIPKDAFPC